MEELINGMWQLSEEVIKLQHELEDKYEAKNLPSRLKTLKSQLKHFAADFQAKYQAEENLHAYANYLNCQKALSVLSDITAETNVFDTIDAIRSVYDAVTYSLDKLSEGDKLDIWALGRGLLTTEDE